MKKPQTKAVAPQSKLEIFDFEQGGDEWVKARLGVITASNFHKVMAGGEEQKTRARYMRQLAGEILTELPAETYDSAPMRRGKEMEDRAREDYAKRHFVELRRIGFAKNSGLMKYAVVGASPDSLVDHNGGLEIKTMMPELMIAEFERGARLLPANRAQVHGNIWVLEREWWDYKIFYDGMPPYEVRVHRDEKYIKEISDAVERFSYELKMLVKKLRDMGARG